ncbi:MAG: SDH family Clp fold serine proteinase [Burkholderiales bacterium]|nr:serine dehydrogenasease [Rhodocyclaceae bacterium]MCA3018590.1 serine dehydrogenasease [Rhodocyclaceae bacterium]MCA3022011.1 serine dehydrogenasease [Rhodocyclaceae bacterium]MCA3024904.1 serine dehydrogenasease [Rhodocyclaceae bacterium]MCA3032213.1 serine dehydrogenasease [Rhodocyclaceae bacterium]
MNPADLDHTILHHINEKGKELENLLGSDVICYFGQIHPQYFRLFRNYVEDVKAKSKRTEQTLSIVLRTPGGSAETTERFVTVVRNFYTKVNFIVPDLAMSAGTIFCMSGDKIYMDYSSALGPIDPQVLAPDGSGYVAALGYLDKVEEITKRSNLTPADVVFLKGLDLAKLALYEQAKNLSIDLLKTWLAEHKFSTWTKHRTHNAGQPVTQDEKINRAKVVATDLADHKKWFSHGRALDIKKLKQIGLEIDDYSNNLGLSSAIRGYNDLLTAYTDRMGLAFYLHSHLKETVI